MIPGSKLLGDIDTRVVALREEMAAYDARIAALQQEEAAFRNEEAALAQTLAHMRTQEVLRNEVQTFFDDIAHLEQERIAHTEHIAQAVRTLHEEIRTLEQRRQKAKAQHDEMVRRVAQLQHKTQEALTHDDTYQKRLQETATAKSQADAALAQAQEAQKTKEAKAAPYRNDPLFAYLWEQKYGTPEYNAWGLTKVLDGWVAQVAGYEANRRNYALLLEWAKAYQTHAAQRQKHYETLLEQLQSYEKTKAEETGLLEVLDQEREHQKALEAIDTDIDAKERRLHQLLQEQEALFTHEDRWSEAIKERYTRIFQDADIDTLWRVARSSTHARDDELVARIERYRRQRDDIQQRITQLQEEYRRQKARLEELERIRTQYKRRRYDDYRIGFEGVDMGRILGEVIGGAINSGMLWDTLERHRRYRNDFPDPGFGSGTLSERSTPWSMPTLPELDFSFPAQRDFDENGFRTGGGF